MMAAMLDYHNFLVMPVHVAVMVTFLDDDGVLSFGRRDQGYCNSESRECGKSDGKFAP